MVREEAHGIIGGQRYVRRVPRLGIGHAGQRVKPFFLDIQGDTRGHEDLHLRRCRQNRRQHFGFPDQMLSIIED